MHQLNSEGEYTALTVNIQAAASGLNVRDAMRIIGFYIYSQAEDFLPQQESPPQPQEPGLGSGGHPEKLPGDMVQKKPQAHRFIHRRSRLPDG